VAAEVGEIADFQQQAGPKFDLDIEIELVAFRSVAVALEEADACPTETAPKPVPSCSMGIRLCAGKPSRRRIALVIPTSLAVMRESVEKPRVAAVATMPLTAGPKKMPPPPRRTLFGMTL